MAFVNACTEQDDLGGGRFRSIIGLRPTAHLYEGAYRRNDNDWKVATEVGFAKSVSASNIAVDLKGDGTRRMYPTGDRRVYVEIGAPQSKAAGEFAKAPYSVATLATAANKVSWASEYTDLRVIHAGHYVKVECELLKGFVPESKLLAFPLVLSGLTLEKGTLLQEGKPVGRLRDMIVYDADNPLDVRPVAYEVMQVKDAVVLMATLPDVRGMARPVVDPTFEAQPNEAAGKDTFIYGGVENTWNWGTFTTLDVGNQGGGATRTLIAYDLATVPDAFTSAVLSLCAVADVSTNARTYRVYRQKRAWVEGTRAGAADSPATGATWSRYNTTSNWAAGGGFHANDCEQTDIGNRAFSATETLNEFKDFLLTPTTKAGLDLGNGWMVKADTEIGDRYDFASSDYALDPTLRPKLTVEYALGGQPVYVRHLYTPGARMFRQGSA